MQNGGQLASGLSYDMPLHLFPSLFSPFWEADKRNVYAPSMATHAANTLCLSSCSLWQPFARMKQGQLLFSEAHFPAGSPLPALSPPQKEYKWVKDGFGK